VGGLFCFYVRGFGFAFYFGDLKPNQRVKNRPNSSH
jgi:hypothetical protein